MLVVAGPARRAGPEQGGRHGVVHAARRVADRRGALAGTTMLGERQPAGADRGQGRGAAEVRARIRRQLAGAAALQVRPGRRDAVPREQQEVHRQDRRAGHGRPARAGRTCGRRRRPRPRSAAAPTSSIAWSDDPHKFAGQCVDLTDLADYLGEKYGGWWPIVEKYGKSQATGKWIAMPIGGSGNRVVYRKSWVNEAGLRDHPERPRRLPRHGDASSRPTGHPIGFALGNATGDANSWCHWLMWTHRRLADRRERPGHDQQQGDDRGAEIRQGAGRDLHRRRRLLAGPEQQQGLPRRRDLGHRQRHLDLLCRQDLAGRRPSGDGRGHLPCADADRPGRQADRARR